jgi:hypothetical protein
MCFRVIVGKFEIHANGLAGMKSVSQSEAVGFEVYRRTGQVVGAPAHHCTRFEDAFDYCIKRYAIAHQQLSVAH